MNPAYTMVLVPCYRVLVMGGFQAAVSFLAWGVLGAATCWVRFDLHPGIDWVGDSFCADAER